MCDHIHVSEVKLVFSIPPHRLTPNFAPSWNAAPTDLLPVVRYDRKAGERSLDMLRWGLVPFWAKDIKVGFANITVTAEGIAHQPNRHPRHPRAVIKFAEGCHLYIAVARECRERCLLAGPRAPSMCKIYTTVWWSA
jgi:putative SOS response-associated peptidase YedK